MTARPHEQDDDLRLTAEPLDPAFVERCHESLADPRSVISASEVRAHLKALHIGRSER